jgi:hypothetical protein
MPTYLLDMVVESGELYQPCSPIQTPIWIIIQSDGLHQMFSTSQVAPSPRPVWRCPARLVINLPDLDGTHFKATLCTSSPSGSVIAVGSSKVNLSTLPFGTPSRLSFALMSTQNVSVEAANLTMRATLSLLPLQTPQQPTGPYSMPYAGPHLPARSGHPPATAPGAPVVRHQAAPKATTVLNGSTGLLRNTY